MTKCIKKNLIEWPVAAFIQRPLYHKTKAFQRAWGQELKLPWNPSDRRICYGTGEGKGRRVDVTILLQWSHLWYQLLLHYQFSSPSFCHDLLHLVSLQWECSSSYRPWNVSPHWVWHLQIRAHYLGVTCPVPFIYHREGRMCVCCYSPGRLSHKFNSFFWI